MDFSHSKGAPPPQQPYNLNTQRPGGAPPPYGHPPTSMAYPGQPMMAQPYGYGQVTHVQNVIMVTSMDESNNPSLNDHPVRTRCPVCQADITTTTEYVVGCCTWFYCVFIAAFTFFLCCWLPFIWNSTKDVIHTCPSCKAEVGKFERSNERDHRRVRHHRRRGYDDWW